MKTLLTRLLRIFTLFIALLAPVPAFAEMPPPPPMPHMITVSGEGEEEFTPDQVVLSMSLVSKDMNLSTAKKNNDAMVEKLVTIARSLDIPKEKIATSNVNISPEYSYNSSGNKPQFNGYNINRSLRVTMDNLTTHEKLLSDIVDAKIDQVNGIEFRLADPEKYASQVRVKAFDNAKAKATTLAQAAGLKLGQAIDISTTGESPRPPRPMMMRAEMAMDKGSAQSVAPSLPGMVTLHESVTVTFTLE